jgi:hypothetical protein
MNYIDKIKALFFTEKDLGVRYPDELNRDISINSRLIAEGAQSQMLMANPIFQAVVAEMYLTLEAQLDSIEDTWPDAQEQIQWVRVQRRALRQICAVLDNKIAVMETVEQANKEKEDESKSNYES